MIENVPLGTHHPAFRWGYYDANFKLVRELTAEEVPSLLPLANAAPVGWPGWVFRDPDGDGYYICFWA